MELSILCIRKTCSHLRGDFYLDPNWFSRVYEHRVDGQNPRCDDLGWKPNAAMTEWDIHGLAEFHSTIPAWCVCLCVVCGLWYGHDTKSFLARHSTKRFPGVAEVLMDPGSSPPTTPPPASASGLHSRRPSWMPKGDDSPSTSYTSYTEHILAKRLYIHVNAKTWLGGWAIQTHSFEKRNWYIDHVDCLIVRVAMQHGIFSSSREVELPTKNWRLCLVGSDFDEPSLTLLPVPQYLLPSIQGDLFGFQSNGPQVPRVSVSLPYIQRLQQNIW